MLELNKDPKGLPPFRVIRCPVNGNQVSWCRGLCTPDAAGIGICGRIAPHVMVDRTQRAIASYKERTEAAG